MRTNRLCGLVPGVAMLLAPLAGASDTTWIGPSYGSWWDPQNWTNGVPHNPSGGVWHAIVPSGVALGNGADIEWLTIGPGATVMVPTNNWFVVASGGIDGGGTFQLQSNGYTTDLALRTSCTLGAGTTIQGTDTGANRIVCWMPDTALYIAPTARIQGSLSLGADTGLVLLNSGLIDATLSSGIVVDPESWATCLNNGTMRASPGSTLTLSSAILDNWSGLLVADGGTLNITASTLLHGTLRATNGGLVQLLGGSTLEDLAIEGTAYLPTTHFMRARGTLTIPGTLQLNSNGYTTDLVLDTPTVLLNGNGSLAGTATLANRVIANGGGDALLHIAPGFVVRGSMQLGADTGVRLLNEGTIRGDNNGGVQLDLVGPFTDNANRGVIESTLPGGIVITGSELDNSLGVIVARTGATTQIAASDIHGGHLAAEGSGYTLLTNGSTLFDVTIDGTAYLPTTHYLRLVDRLTVTGTVVSNSNGYTTDAVLLTPVFSLAGNGTWFATDTLANRLYGAEGLGTKLTIDPGFLLSGSMSLGVDSLTLDNHGTIRASGNTGILLDLTGTADDNRNAGLIEAEAPSNVALAGTQLDNVLGEVVARSGAFVRLDGSRLVGGSLRAEEGAYVLFQNGSTIADLTFQGIAYLPTTHWMRLAGTITNNGTILSNSNGYTTDTLIDGPTVTFLGSGSWQATDTLANRLYVADGTPHLLVNGPGHTMHGSVQLGANTPLDILNLGTIRADASSGMTIDLADQQTFTNEGLLHASGGWFTIWWNGFLNHGEVRLDPSYGLVRYGDYQQTAGTTKVNGTLTVSGGEVKLIGGRLMGIGTVNATVTATGGVLAPGNDSAPGSRALSIQGHLSLLAGSVYEVQCDGNGYDAVVLPGRASTAYLAGTLRVERNADFQPTPVEWFTILTAGARSGVFAGVDSCDEIELAYGPGSVSMRFVALHGAGEPDLDGNGTVNSPDLAILLGAWGPCADPCCPADLDGDGTVGPVDLATLLGAWGT